MRRAACTLLVLAALLGLAAPAGAQQVWQPTTVAGWNRHAEHPHHDLIVEPFPGIPGLATRVTIHRGDRFAGAPRSEWRPEPSIEQAEGETYWFGFSLWLPPGYADPGGWGRIYAQMHGGSGSPVWAIRHDPSGSLHLDLRGGGVDQNHRSARLLSAIPRGRVLHFKLHVRASAGRHGHTRVWINGQLAADEQGPNKYAGGGYFKSGGYGGEPRGGADWFRIGGWVKAPSEAVVDAWQRSGGQFTPLGGVGGDGSGWRFEPAHQLDPLEQPWRLGGEPYALFTRPESLTGRVSLMPRAIDLVGFGL